MTFFLLYNPITDTAMLSGILILIFGSENKNYLTPINLLLAAAFSLIFLLDELDLIATIYGVEIIPVLNPLWTMPYIFTALASLYPTAEPIVKNIDRLEKILNNTRILLPYSFAFAILFLIGIEYAILDTLFAWAILMLVLLSMRQIFVLFSNKRLMSTIQKNEENLKRLNAKITHDAEVDFLTQLFNRRYIDQTFEKLIPVDENPENLGLILIDVDYFKRINDTFGHQIGDEVLQGVARVIKKSTRRGDIAGRFGGDEFIVLLPGANRQTIGIVSERLETRIREDASMKKYGVSLSIGGSSMSFNRSNYKIEKLLKQADDALYHAKENGRDQFMVYSESNESLPVATVGALN